MQETKNYRYGLFWLNLLIIITLSGQSCYAGWDPTKELEQQNNTQSKEVIARFLKANPKLNIFFKKAYAYVVFPSVKKGGLIFGGAMGKGILYQRGKAIGTVSLKQATFGLQLGGQIFSELIFFKDRNTTDRFKAGGIKFNAQTSAVAVADYGSANLDYNQGIATFTLAETGVMAEAALGGQHFKFEPF